MNRLRVLEVLVVGGVIYALGASFVARAYANKCGASVVYDLHLESITPSTATFPPADSGDWPTEWPADASVQLAGYDTDLVLDDAHVLHTN